MTRHSLHVTTFKFYQNFYSEFVNIMNFCGALWIQKILFSVYSKVVNHTRTLDDTSSRRSSRLRIGALVPCPLGPGSVVGIATGYGLDGPGIESRWGGEIFRTCPDRPWGPPSLLYNGYRVFPGGKEGPGHDTDLSHPSSAVGHETVYLYSPYGLYSLYRASVPVQGWPLPLPPFPQNTKIMQHYMLKTGIRCSYNTIQ